jgi:omega-amidase
VSSWFTLFGLQFADSPDIPRGMQALAVQLDIAWEDKPANFAKVRQLLESAKPQPGSLIVLPEMFSTGFSMNVAAVREGEDRPAEKFLSELSQLHKAYVVGGVVNLGPDGKGLNQALTFGPEGQPVARYDKIHPFTLADEAVHYTAGRQIALFTWQGAGTKARVAPFVCYDLRFPEVFRSAVRRGAQVMAVIANWPARRADHWVTLLKARAIENQAYVVGVNRCGTDPKHTYPGRSLIVDPHGNVLADAGEREGVIQAPIDPTLVDSWRRDFPALKDMHWHE